MALTDRRGSVPRTCLADDCSSSARRSTCDRTRNRRTNRESRYDLGSERNGRVAFDRLEWKTVRVVAGHAETKTTGGVVTCPQYFLDRSESLPSAILDCRDRRGVMPDESNSDSRR